MAFFLLITLWGMILPAQAVEIRGTVGVGAEILPDLLLDADINVTFSGEDWQLRSDTNIGLFPAFGGIKRLTFSYDLEVLRIGANAAFALSPIGFTRADLYGTVDLLDPTLGEGEPNVLVSSDLTIGTMLNGGFDPYARVSTRFTFGDHWLSNTTTATFIPFDVVSSLLGHVSFGTFDVADGAVTVTAHGTFALSLIPFDFSYVQANAKVMVDGVSILNTVTYYGGTSFMVKSTATIDLDPVTVKIWGSYSSTATDPFGLGLSASVGWGPL